MRLLRLKDYIRNLKNIDFETEELEGWVEYKFKHRNKKIAGIKLHLCDEYSPKCSKTGIVNSLVLLDDGAISLVGDASVVVQFACSSYQTISHDYVDIGIQANDLGTIYPILGQVAVLSCYCAKLVAEYRSPCILMCGKCFRGRTLGLSDFRDMVLLISLVSGDKALREQIREKISINF